MTITEGGVIRLAVWIVRMTRLWICRFMGCLGWHEVVGFADLWGVQDDMRLWVLLILGVFRMI